MNTKPTSPAARPDPASPRTRQTTLVVIAILGAALLVVGLATGRTAQDLPTTSAEWLRVEVQTATPSPSYTLRREFTGRIEARRESSVGFEREGALLAVHADEGDAVPRGTLLAELDRDRLNAQRRELVAVRDQVRADLELAEATRQRVADALALDAISTQEDDEAATAVRAQQAALARAEAAIERIDVELAKTRLTAPYDALVADRLADEGQVVAAGQPLLRLLERRAPEARIGVAGSASESLRTGQRHSLTVEGRTVWGMVERVLPQRDPGTRSVEVVLRLEDSLGNVTHEDAALAPPLLRGDLVRLSLEETVETVGFWLPMSALTESTRGLWAIYVAAEDDTTDGLAELERRELEVLHQEADRVFVRGALTAGERVVVEGLQRLVPGQRVEVLSAKSSTEDTATATRSAS